MTRVWTVRGGRFGEREQEALDEGLIVLGWDDLGDLSGVASVEEIVALLGSAYSDDAARTIENWAHQLWRFLMVMQIGDLVVMPRKFQSVVAIARITGGYEYMADADMQRRHTRQVEWLNQAVERTAFGGDLRDSMGSLLTVSELSRRDAAKRVETLARSGVDPGYEGYIAPPATPDALKQEVEESGTLQLSARDLIGLWDLQRRTTEGIERVDQGLTSLGLRVDPHFTSVQLDALVTVASLGTQEDVVAEDEVDDTGVGADLAWRIGNLSLARVVATARAERPIGTAVERMVADEYSQLPVVDEHGRLAGVITWESIAHAQLVGNPKTVADAMHPSHTRTIRETEELFARIDDVKKRGYLIVVDAENVVAGILTAADLAGELRNRVQPFTVLEEIERRLRRAVACMSVDDLRASFPKGHPQAKKVHAASDLTLGNYSYLLDDEARWGKLGWPYERADMVEHLRKLAVYRNDIAHWNLDAPGSDSDELVHAKQVLKLLKLVDRDPA
jgi:restriction system protein